VKSNIYKAVAFCCSGMRLARYYAA
jgi:hypothetical protein